MTYEKIEHNVRIDRKTGSVDVGDAHLGMIINNYVALQGDLTTKDVVDSAAAHCRKYGVKVEVYYAP